MKMAMRCLKRIVEGLSSVTGALASICIGAAALIITEGVLTRKFLEISGTWQIELSVFLLIFSCFVGAAFVQKKDHHLNVDLVLIHLSPKSREITLIAVSIISCALCALIAWFAWPMWWEALIQDDHSESYWGPPLWIPYFFLPFGMSLFFFQYIIHIIKKVNLLRSGKLIEDVARTELKDIDIPELKQTKLNQ
jgi:TRAP-type C4-dicarboxylate transport system permease small subunit